MDACKHVTVTWVDSTSFHRWTSREGLESPDLRVTSVGFLFHEDDECVGLTTSWAADPDSVINPLWIPRRAVLEMHAVECVKRAVMYANGERVPRPGAEERP